MEIKYILFGLLFLVACSDTPTGQVVADPMQEEVGAAQATIAQLEAQIAELEVAVVNAQDAQAVAETQFNELVDAYETAENTLAQQRVILREMDNERAKAVEAAEGCDERIESLETSNEKLQDMLDICQEDLS